MRRTRIEHMSSAYHPIATAKADIPIIRAGERPLFAEPNLWNVVRGKRPLPKFHQVLGD
jgi:hypothetical protein